jgi:hypothetical protein
MECRSPPSFWKVIDPFELMDMCPDPISAQDLNSVNVFALRTLLKLLLLADACASGLLNPLVIQRELFFVIWPIGPMFNLWVANTPSWMHPPPEPPKKGSSNPGMSLVSWVRASTLMPPGRVRLAFAPFPPNPCSTSQSGDFSHWPPASGVSRCQSLSNH